MLLPPHVHILLPNTPRTLMVLDMIQSGNGYAACGLEREFHPQLGVSRYTRGRRALSSPAIYPFDDELHEASRSNCVGSIRLMRVEYRRSVVSRPGKSTEN